ncbi:hypothetical protein AF72_03645 [Xylella taiwanensis]|uniref:Uncharacterized protein n=1 Tax=Xylella taiwanensis TaxID=1444770 RepID=Z9JKH4_9GAMM|nr:hypothetical protein AF72_03645 [Xylella taiwanensis]
MYGGAIPLAEVKYQAANDQDNNKMNHLMT